MVKGGINARDENGHVHGPAMDMSNRKFSIGI